MPREYISYSDVAAMRDTLFIQLAYSVYNMKRRKNKQSLYAYADTFNKRGTKWYIDIDNNSKHRKRFIKAVMRAFAENVGARKLKHGQYSARWGNKKFYFHYSGGSVPVIVITRHRQNFDRE